MMLVSVVVPVFNGAATVACAIKSVLAQEFDGEFEVIVVNDGSTDRTARVLRSFGDRIRIVTQENRGLSAARNVGTREACGRYIAWIDADDVWLPGRLGETVIPLEKDRNVVGAFADGVEVDARGRSLNRYIVPPAQRHAPSLDEMLRTLWEIRPSAALVRRDLLEWIGGFPEEFGRSGYGGEDVLTFLRLRQFGPLLFVAKPLIRYTVSSFDQVLNKRAATLLSVRGRSARREQLQLLLRPHQVFANLVRLHFGVAGQTLARAAQRYQADMLTALGLHAINRGDTALARECYLMALKVAPAAIKTWLRLAFAYAPEAVASRVLSVVPMRARRALVGPPFGAAGAHAT